MKNLVLSLLFLFTISFMVTSEAQKTKPEADNKARLHSTFRPIFIVKEKKTNKEIYQIGLNYKGLFQKINDKLVYLSSPETESCSRAPQSRIRIHTPTLTYGCESQSNNSQCELNLTENQLKWTCHSSYSGGVHPDTETTWKYFFVQKKGLLNSQSICHQAIINPNVYKGFYSAHLQQCTDVLTPEAMKETNNNLPYRLSKIEEEFSCKLDAMDCLCNGLSIIDKQITAAFYTTLPRILRGSTCDFKEYFVPVQNASAISKLLEDTSVVIEKIK